MNFKLNLNLTLSQQLSLAFSILLLACCGASAWLQVRANDMHEKEVVQGLSRDLAESIAVDTRVMGADGLQPDVVRRLFDQLMMVNPSVEVYLLDARGVIIGHAAPAGHLKRHAVDLAPIHRLLANEALPILGDDPRSVAGRKVFSAAALHAGQNIDGPVSGYIYVVLLGEEHDRLAARVAASAVLRTTLWSMGLVALLGLLAGLLALRLITRPLHRLTETMRHFDTQAEPVNLPMPLPPAPEPEPPLRWADRRDEIAVLETTFDQMASRIGEQWRTLTRQDQERRELVANISHDLRTPLGSLHGYLETLLLKDATLDPAERQRYLGIALAQSGKVGKLAQSLFELARLEHGVVEPALEPFSLSDLVQDVFQKCELTAQDKGVRLDASVPRDAAIVAADLGMIERVLTNLLDNAIRHTPPGGSVDVALRRDGERVLVTVGDTGPGIPPALLENLFRRPFSSGDDHRNGGLGLLIVQRILQLHGSGIELLTVPGKGAVFQFMLPVPQPDKHGPACP
jgi:signal transduction histidine kinase